MIGNTSKVLKSVQTLGEIFNKYEVKKEKSTRVTQEFQDYALRLADKLNDRKHIGIYMRLAKLNNTALLDRALSFVADSNANNRAALFMWKVKQLKINKAK